MNFLKSTLTWYWKYYVVPADFELKDGEFVGDRITLDDGSDEKRTILSGIHAYYEPEELVGKTCIAITNLPPRKMMGIDSCGMLISTVHKEGEDEKLHLLMVDPGIPAGAKLY